MANSVPRTPTALVSWAQRDPSWTHTEVADWRQQVTVFARALRSHGIDVKLDQWVQDPLVDWSRWGQRMVDECDFVIVAMNQRWADCWKGSHDLRTNAGVSREIDHACLVA